MILALALAVSTCSIAAPPERITVLVSLAAPDHRRDLDPAAVRADLERLITSRIGLELVSNEAVFVVGGEATKDELEDCGADVACLSVRLAALGIDRGLIAAANLIVEPPVVFVELLATKTRTASVATESVRAHDRGAIAGVIHRLAERVLDSSGYREAGRITIHASPPEAQIMVLGEQLPRIASTCSVIAGRHRVRAELEGYEPREIEVDVVAGRETIVDLMLTPKAALIESPWFWGLVGVIAAGGAAALLIGLSSHDHCLCVADPHGPCPKC